MRRKYTEEFKRKAVALGLSMATVIVLRDRAWILPRNYWQNGFGTVQKYADYFGSVLVNKDNKVVKLERKLQVKMRCPCTRKHGRGRALRIPKYPYHNNASDTVML